MSRCKLQRILYVFELYDLFFFVFLVVNNGQRYRKKIRSQFLAIPSIIGIVLISFFDQVPWTLILVLHLMQYGIKIFVITSFKDTCYIEILPNIQKSERGNTFFLFSHLFEEPTACHFHHVSSLCSYFPELLGRGSLQLNIS